MMKSITVVVGLVALLGLLSSGCGTLNPNTQPQIASAVQAKEKSFRACYASALRRNRNLKGRMTIEFRVDKDSGKVEDAKVVKSAIKDRTMKKCVVKVANGMSVPEAPGKYVDGVYEIDFQFES